MTKTLQELLAARFGAPVPAHRAVTHSETLKRIAARGSCRSFKPGKLSAGLIRTLCAVALCAPAKSDLQQRDIIIVDDARRRQKLDGLLTGGPLGQPCGGGCTEACFEKLVQCLGHGGGSFNC